MNEDQLQAHLISGNVTATSYGSYRNLAPHIVCADGLVLSVQASHSHYCSPRSDIGPYHTVEIGFPSVRVEELMPYAEDLDNPTETVYAQVPVETVLQIINSRGGVYLDQ